VVVLPSCCRVAAIKTRGVTVFMQRCRAKAPAIGCSSFDALGFAFRFCRLRMEIPVTDGFDADNGRDAENVVGVGAA